MDSWRCCACTKPLHTRPFGTLVALETPARPWSTINLVFIVKLSVSDGHTVVLMVVDHLTKVVHFIPCNQLPSAEATVQLVLHNMVLLNGLSDHSF